MFCSGLLLLVATWEIQAVGAALALIIILTKKRGKKNTTASNFSPS
jgi:hypothetical protein